MRGAWRKVAAALALPAVVVGTSLLPAEVAASPGEGAALARIPIEDPSGAALDGFFAQLRRTSAHEPEAVTRVAHYGDSLIVGDLITRTLRRLYQERYGDAGPGFVLAGRPWPWYRHQGVASGASEGWSAYHVLGGGLRDRLYGYGGAALSTRDRNRRVWFRAVPDGGRAVRFSRIDVHYLAQPRGGDLDILVDGEHVMTLSTASETRGSAFHELLVPDGVHEVALRTSGSGEVRLFGVALEREGPGFVYDSLGVNGACATSLGRSPEEHLEEQLRHRQPGLIVLGFGANESNLPALVRSYERTLAPLLGSLRRAAPGSSCLLVAPLDRAERGASGRVRSNPRVPRIVEAQRRAAFAAGCAFYDTFGAMGGEGAMLRWYRGGLASPDLTHPTPEGGEALGGALFEALEAAFRASGPGR